MPRDNLLNSACLELFEFIKRENLKTIIQHLVTTYRSRLQEITYVDTFQNLILRYDQMNHNAEADMTLFSNDGTPNPSRTPNNVNGNRWQGLPEVDAAEQAYFDTSDNEDDSPSTKKHKTTSNSPFINGLAASPIIKSLVNYPDDDDDDDGPQPPTIPTAPSKLRPSSMLQTPPPERLSEKRRREEDNDEDELGKLTVTKRRNSGSSVSSTGSAAHGGGGSNNTLRRRKGYLGKERDSPTTTQATATPNTGGGTTRSGAEKERKRIAISLTAKNVASASLSEGESKRVDGG